MYISHNGKLIPQEEAAIPVDNIEWTYGFGVYENLKVRHAVTYFVDLHVDRLFRSAELIGLEHSFEKEEIKTWIDELKEKNDIESANIKMLLVGGKSPNLYMMTLAPKFVEKKLYKTGVHTITSQYERYLPQAKTLNMLPSYLIYREAKAAGAHDALLIDTNGHVIEGTRSNFFAIKGTELITAPEDSVLNGVTRHTVIECAKDNGYTLTERALSLQDIHGCDGAFLTHTSGKIVPITSIDDFSFTTIHEPINALVKHYNTYLDTYVQKKKAS